MSDNNQEEFPLSKEKSVKGTRRLAREKVLQIILSYDISENSIDELFDHIYHRLFNFGDDEEEETNEKGFLRPEQILEMEADVPIRWKDDDIEFGKLLIEKVLAKRDYLNELIEEFAKNWQLERIAVIDRILVQMAITELEEFQEIPPKVSINESIEIAKKYSTDKSRSFINGILDSIMKKLKREGKINKSGRGLVE